MEEHIKRVLELSGWNSKRSVDISFDLNLLKEHGYSVHDRTIEFLKEFSNLIISFTNKRNQIEDDITLVVKNGIELEVMERLIEDYSPRLNGENLNIIGTAYRDYFVLMMGESGAIYGGYDDYLVKIEDTGINGLINIVEDKDFVEIGQVGNV